MLFIKLVILCHLFVLNILITKCNGEILFQQDSNILHHNSKNNAEETILFDPAENIKLSSKSASHDSTFKNKEENTFPQKRDFVAVQTEIVGKSKVKLKAEWNLNEYNDITFYGFYVDDFYHRTIFYNRQLGIYKQNKTAWKDSIELLIDLPNELFYYNHQNTTHPTNFYVSQLGFRTMLDLVNPEDNDIVVSVEGDMDYLPFLHPLDRTQLPIYCLSWGMHIENLLKTHTIPFCRLLSDTNIFSTVLPMAGTTGGFTRKLSNLTWPSHILSHIKSEYEENLRFSVTMWLFLTEYCPKSCMLLQSRNATSYHSPLLILNREGHLHVQLHASGGSAEAFLSAEKLPLFTWMYILLSVDTSRAELSIHQVGNKAVTSHRSFDGLLRFVFGGNNSLVVVGGYRGNRGFHGYMGPVHVYQKLILSHASVFQPTLIHDAAKQLERFRFSHHHKRCVVIRKIVHHYLGVVDDLGRCVQKTWWHRVESPSLIGNKFLDLNKNKRRNETANIIRIAVEESKLSNLSTYDEVALKIHKMAIKHLKKKWSSKSSVLPLLEVSGCLGHSQSFFVTATIYRYGIGVQVDTEMGVKYHLIAAQMNNPLSQLSLAYRHQLQLDGLAKDTSVQAGYMGLAAKTSKDFFDAENHQVHVQTEMIRLDQAESFQDVRGKDSQLFKWLLQQAKMGSMEARNQVAEMLFHGKQGIAANPDQAIQYFHEAAEAGDPVAMFNLGVMHIKGIKGFEKNLTKAKKYFKKATEGNSSLAYSVLGFMELNYNMNRSGAMHYWKKASDMNDMQATYNLGSMHETGGADGNSTDTKKAVELYRKSASQGEMHSCMKLGDMHLEGAIIKRDEITAIRYYEYLAHQLQGVGMLMRNGIDDYIDGKRYSSFLNYLFGAESGIQLAGYNVALLLERAKAEIQDTVQISDENYFYNFTGELGWSLSLMKMGHVAWSNETNTELASKYYARSIENNNNPEALFYLGYLVEHGYPLHKDLTINNVTSRGQMKNNLTMAETLYQGCIDSTSENAEGYYPCHMALMKLHVKSFIKRHFNFTQRKMYLTFMIACILATIIALVFIITLRQTIPATVPPPSEEVVEELDKYEERHQQQDNEENNNGEET